MYTLLTNHIKNILNKKPDIVIDENILINIQDMWFLIDDNSRYDCLFKIVCIGKENTGKTTFCQTLEGKKNEYYLSTIGVDLHVKTFQSVINNKIIALQICDSSGQERFTTITTSYLKTSRFVYFFYRDNKPEQDYINFIKKYSYDRCVFICIKNKKNTHLQVLEPFSDFFLHFEVDVTCLDDIIALNSIMIETFYQYL